MGQKKMSKIIVLVDKKSTKYNKYGLGVEFSCVLYT